MIGRIRVLTSTLRTWVEGGLSGGECDSLQDELSTGSPDHLNEAVDPCQNAVGKCRCCSTWLSFHACFF